MALELLELINQDKSVFLQPLLTAEKVIENKANQKQKYFEKEAKPFVKWAGGKGQLLNKIRIFYPFSQKITKYAEPFIGGGAVLFDILNNYSLEEIYISDINAKLINTYHCIKNNVDELIALLYRYEVEYNSLCLEDRKKYYLEKRDCFNSQNSSDVLLEASLLIFLNKTCFNGLYRVNSRGLFNVPMGAYKKPTICDIENLKEVSKKLQNVKIVCADYTQSLDFIDDKTFVYFDPPYRPLSSTSNFTTYAENSFDDNKQKELAKFIHQVCEKNAFFLLSNSDPKQIDENDVFFDELYSQFFINRISATRMINSKGDNRGKISELLISNRKELLCQETLISG